MQEARYSNTPRLTVINRIMVDEDGYALTKFQHEHPGGQKSEFARPSLFGHIHAFAPEMP